MRVLYGLSDLIVFPLFYYALRYRRKLVRRNLAAALPERSQEERAAIERRFYRHLADQFVETVKEMSISHAAMKRRMEFVNLDQVERQLAARQQRHCFLYVGHYCNWEWAASLPLWSTEARDFGQIYHPLHNALLDRLFLHMRERFGVRCIAMKETLRTLLDAHRRGEHTMVGFIADQAPKIEAMHHWTTFLHQETSFFTGAEKIGRKIGAAFYYMEFTRRSRGRYAVRLVPIETDAPTPEQPYPATDAFARMLENDIRCHPHLWLWTHNRWKRTRADRTQWEQRHANRRDNTTP